MKSRQNLLAILLVLLFSVPATAQGLKMERLPGDYVGLHLSAEEQSKYLLLPIEETAHESQITIVADGQLCRTLNVRIASNKIDYYLPLHLDEFRGKEVMMYIHFSINHSNRGGVGSEPRIRGIKLSDSFTPADEHYRPIYHHTPEYGWMNDPNGMFYLDGVWHLYYQYNPYGSMWGNMHWAHATSTDLINWKQHGIVLSPDAHGTIFSGSCVVDKEGTAGFGKNAVIAMYTSCIQTPHGHDIQTQSLAYSTDGGYTFTKYAGNPVLTAKSADFRDPNPFWNEDIKAWNLIMAAGQEMRIYSSPDLKHWKEESRFGRGLGCHYGVWECPDLIKVKGEGTGESKWVLICNLNPGGPYGGSATQYFVGDFDGREFTVDDETRYTAGKALWQDYGKDHYAAVSFYNAPDNRHTMMAWMSNWQYANEVPTKQFRSSNTIARDPFLYKAGGKYYLGSRPAPEYDEAGLDKEFKINGSRTITLANDDGDEFVISYDQKAMTLSVDRTNCGNVEFSEDFAAKTVAPLHRKLTSIRVFVDNASVEVFGNDGEVVMTNLVFPTSPLNTIK